MFSNLSGEEEEDEEEESVEGCQGTYTDAIGNKEPGGSESLSSVLSTVPSCVKMNEGSYLPSTTMSRRSGKY